MKKRIIFGILCMALVPGLVRASTDDFTSVATEDALANCLVTDKACRLSSNMEFSSFKNVKGDVILDLNGFELKPKEDLERTSGLISINRGGKLTLVDSKGTGKITTGYSGKVYAAINLIDNGDDGEGVAELVMNSGSLEGYYYGVVGNGKRPNTKVTINGGSIKTFNTEDSAGIYQPQDGKMTINGGVINGGTGIEIRSGKLTINAGTIKGVASNFLKEVNTNGTTTNGVGLAIAQHTTKKPIDVVVNGGSISGQYAIYEWNPHANPKDDIDKIKLTVKDGVFEGFATGVKCVYSEDLDNFIYGGKFTPNIDKYLADGANVVSKEVESNEEEEVDNKKKSHAWVVVTISILGIAGVVVAVLYKKLIK